jgi:hypothetical protein
MMDDRKSMEVTCDLAIEIPPGLEAITERWSVRLVDEKSCVAESYTRSSRVYCGV